MNSIRRPVPRRGRCPAPVSFRQRVSTLSHTGSNVLALHAVSAVPSGVGYVKVSCPEHDDEHPSFSVNLETGRGRCFVCGFATGDVVALHRALGHFDSMGMALGDLERRSGAVVSEVQVERSATRTPGPRAGRPVGRMECVRVWTYERADGSAAFEIRRLQWFLPDGNCWKKPGAEKPYKIYVPSYPGGSPRRMPEPYASGALRPLYRLPELIAADPRSSIYVVEGEPAADALRGVGCIATTSSGGSGNPHSSDWAPLAGRDVIVWPDNDDAGAGYADAVAHLLVALDSTPRVRRVDASRLNLPVGGDAVDWLRAREGQR